MKRINILLSAFIIAFATPSWAAFCTNCGTNISDNANFCSSCGTPVSRNEESVEQVSTSAGTVYYASSLEADNASLADYHFINRIEDLLSSSSSSSALRQCQELKRQNAGILQQLDSGYLNYSIYRRKIHDLHIEKLNALEEYLNAWRDSEYTSEKARNKAMMYKQAFIIDKMNEAIDMLLSGGNIASNINKVEDLQKRVKKTTVNYIVTSQYITLGNVRVNRNEPIWVEDVSGASAKVYHMGNSSSAEPANGYLSIYDLAKRSNWVSDSAFFYSTGPVVTNLNNNQSTSSSSSSNLNIVVWNGVYPYRRWVYKQGRPTPRPVPPSHHKPHYKPAPVPPPVPVKPAPHKPDPKPAPHKPTPKHNPRH